MSLRNTKTQTEEIIIDGNKYLIFPTERLEQNLGPTAYIASGAFGSVSVGASIADKSLVAVKLIEVDASNQKAIDEINKEVEIMQHLGKRAIIHELDSDDPDKRKMYIIGDFIEGRPLANFLDKQMKILSNENLSELEQLEALDKIVTAFISCCEATQAMQENDVVHGDLHGGNILYDEERNHATIIDFGLSQILAPGETEKYVPGDLYDVSENKSPALHHAPELGKATKKLPRSEELHRIYNKSTDVYALAVDFLINTSQNQNIPSLCDKDDLKEEAQAIQEELMTLANKMSQNFGSKKNSRRISIEESLSTLTEIKDHLSSKIAEKKVEKQHPEYVALLRSSTNLLHSSNHEKNSDARIAPVRMSSKSLLTSSDKNHDQPDPSRPEKHSKKSKKH